MFQWLYWHQSSGSSQEMFKDDSNLVQIFIQHDSGNLFVLLLLFLLLLLHSLSSLKFLFVLDWCGQLAWFSSEDGILNGVVHSAYGSPT